MEFRGTGKTTKQLLNASKNAIFICSGPSTLYTKILAGKLNRGDIKIYGFYETEELIRKFRGISKDYEIIFDHWLFDGNILSQKSIHLLKAYRLIK